jgi:hypothetical protein
VRETFLNGLAQQVEDMTSVTGMIDGEPMVCGGVIEIWNGRGLIWTVFSEKSKHCFLPVFRGIKKFIDAQPYTRLEISIPINLKFAMRRAEMLGFKLECACAKKFLPDGTDCALYAIVRD